MLALAACGGGAASGDDTPGDDTPGGDGGMCTDACDDGAVRCATDTDGVQTCGVQADGCLGWGDAATCGEQTCVDGACICPSSLCGAACELVVSEVASCDACAVPTRFGAACDQSCPGTLPGGLVACSGHGQCSAGTFGTGRCACDAGFGLADCSAACPSAPAPTTSRG